MGALLDIYFSKEKLKSLYETVEKKQLKGVGITLSINDETNEFGQNVSGAVSQTKEEREQKKPRFYTCNGKVFWTDGKITAVQNQSSTQSAQAQPYTQPTQAQPFAASTPDDSDLPF